MAVCVVSGEDQVGCQEKVLHQRMEQAAQGNDRSTKMPEIEQCSQIVWIWGVHVCSLKSGWIILVDPLQLGIFCDPVITYIINPSFVN